MIIRKQCLYLFVFRLHWLIQPDTALYYIDIFFILYPLSITIVNCWYINNSFVLKFKMYSRENLKKNGIKINATPFWFYPCTGSRCANITYQVNICLVILTLLIYFSHNFLYCQWSLMTTSLTHALERQNKQILNLRVIMTSFKMQITLKDSNFDWRLAKSTSAVIISFQIVNMIQSH